jgi:hypothetical protein
VDPQRNKRLAIRALLAIVILIGIEYALHLHEVKRQATALTPPTPSVAVTNTNPPPSPPPVVAAATNVPVRMPGGALQNLFDAVKAAPDAKAARQALAALRAALAAMPKDQAVALVRQYLDSKSDASTHLGFKVASNGTLDDAPTLRTFLLDELGRLDPGAAADYSKVILDSKDSPDEWAVALRNLANGDSSDTGKNLLQQKANELLQYSSWQGDPSTGYLEAFDVAVYVGGTNLMPTLSDLVRKQDNPAVAHAAFLALDRLVINAPATTLAALESDPDMMQGREQTRADYFARADVRDPAQKQVLENYLLDQRVSPTELDAFAGVYPNANYMISPNLLTQNVTPDRASLTSRDAESLAVAQQWAADPRFANVQPALQKMISRLQVFVQQAQQGH